MTKIRIAAAAALVAALWSTAAAAADIVVIRREVTVARPADQVWAKVGGYCAIAEWLKVTCAYTGGTGGLGSVRLLNNATEEVMVTQGPRSYTYFQSIGNMTPYGYHGSLEAEPAGRGATRLIYTLVYNQQPMTPEQRVSEHARLSGRFQGALETMKTMAEAR